MNNRNFIGLSTKEASSELARAKGYVTIMINRAADHWMVPSDCKSDSVEKLPDKKTLVISEPTEQRKRVTFQLDEHEPPSKQALPGTTVCPLQSCLKKRSANLSPNTDSPGRVPHTNSAPKITTTKHVKSRQEIPHTNSAPDIMCPATDAPTPPSAKKSLQKRPDRKSEEDFEIPHIHSPRLSSTTEPPPRKCCGCLLVPGVGICSSCAMCGRNRRRRSSSQESLGSLEALRQRQEPSEKRGSFAVMCKDYAQYLRNTFKGNEGTRQRNASIQPDVSDRAHEAVESWRMSLQFPEDEEHEEKPTRAKYERGRHVCVSPSGKVLTFKSKASTLHRRLAGSKLCVHLIELRKGSRRGWLGMRLRGSVSGTAPIIVKDIIRGGPADKAGKVQRGDEVIEVNGVPLANMSVKEAISHVRKIPCGKVLIIVRRHAELRALNGIRKMLAKMQVYMYVYLMMGPPDYTYNHNYGPCTSYSECDKPNPQGYIRTSKSCPLSEVIVYGILDFGVTAIAFILIL